MIFKTMPQNGASWLKPLLYSIEFEQREEQVAVEIYDELTDSQLGRILLYNTSSVEIDIAPYIRNKRLPLPLADQKSIIAISPDVCRVVLRVNGEESEPIVLFRSDIGVPSPRILSAISESDTVALGERIRLTLLARRHIKILVVNASDVGFKTVEFDNDGLPCEVVVPVERANINETVVLRIECDGVLVGVSYYRVVERDDSAVRLAWHNAQGGMECHTFPQSLRRSLAIKSEDIEGECGWYRRVVGSTIVRRLVMSGLLQSEVDSILDILLSPRVYRCDNESNMAVQLLTDTILYDDHGKLRRLEFDIKEEWKGGALCVD